MLISVSATTEDMLHFGLGYLIMMGHMAIIISLMEVVMT